MTDSPPRLFVIGDSISMHYGPFLEKLAAGRFAYARKEDDAGAPRGDSDLDVPTGANGGDSAMVLAYLRHRRTHEPIRADILLLNCGLHDIKADPATGARQIPLAQYGENLRAIVAEAAAMRLRLVWVRTTPVVDEVHNARSGAFFRHARDVAAYNAAADAVMAGAGVPCLDLHAFSERHLPAGFCDHVHFTEPVRKLQAAFLLEGLERIAAEASFRRGNNQ